MTRKPTKFDLKPVEIGVRLDAAGASHDLLYLLSMSHLILRGSRKPVFFFPTCVMGVARSVSSWPLAPS
jgi:hypothetical protein